ncbi:unnamed protein product [Prunus armeniaca]
MRTVLQSLERGQTSYRVDSRMRPSISRLEELHEQGTTIVKIAPRRSSPPLPFGIKHCLRPYFQAHEITVLTNQPLWHVLQKLETSGQLVKWAIELGEFDIQFKPKPAEKGQAVADFISELTPSAPSETSFSNAVIAELGDYVLQEVHSGVCDDHSGSRSLAHKVFRQGYFWPTLHQDANVLVKKCDKCQRFGSVPHIPAEPLSPIVSPWPFAQWGLDLIGPMPQGKGQVEAEALATITTTKMEDFIWTNICCQFGIPYAIIASSPPIERSLTRPKELGRRSFQKHYGPFGHPTERQPGKHRSPWPLARKRCSSGNRRTFPPNRNFRPKANEEALALSLDLVEERRAQANLRNEAYKQRVSRYYDSRVRSPSFRVGDWVMRKISLATNNPTEGTLGPSWEAPYEIVSIQRSGTYPLRDSNRKTLGHPWNVEHLKYYFK